MNILIPTENYSTLVHKLMQTEVHRHSNYLMTISISIENYSTLL